MPIRRPTHKRAEEEQEVTEEAVAAETDNSADKELRANGVYTIWGDIVQGTLKEIHQDVTLKQMSGDEVECYQLIINSDGGNLSEAYALIDLFNSLNQPVLTMGFGTCASAAAMLLAAGTKGMRVVAPSTQIMIHAYSWGSAGKHHELVSHRKPEDDSYKHMLDFWIENSKYTTKRQVEKHLLRSEDVWLTAQEALTHGIIDRILPPGKKPQITIKDDEK